MKVDLKNVLDQRDVVYQETAEYLELRNNVLTFKGEEGKMKTKMNLGHEFFVEATIKETKRIMVEVGLGFVVEFTLEEALEFIDWKEEQLNTKSKKLTELALEIKAQIKMMLHALQQLADLS
uniref:Uncharacterized protein n=1 Tax=Arcella intermedia TaxID=1963864 RepID=A0A6B2LRG3_9EUKA